MTRPALVVAGASAGGVAPLLELAAALPPGLPAALCVTLHIGSQPSILPELLSTRSPLPARHALDGESLKPGFIYVAPPDRHLLVDDGALRLSHGPRENQARPAIDPLFRTAALHWRERVIGVVLSGGMDDGTAGLAAIKSAGGIALVQDPSTAVEPSMPRSALANVEVDHCLQPAAMGPMIAELLGVERAPPPGWALQEVRDEQALFEHDRGPERLDRIGRRSTLTCPECGGTLWELEDRRPLRYRCHTGHGYTARSLEASQQRDGERNMDEGVRILREREMLLRHMADINDATGDSAQAAVGRRKADALAAQLQSWRHFVDGQAAEHNHPALPTQPS